jgi:NAD-dependent deacetylase sirtuin 4
MIYSSQRILPLKRPPDPSSFNDINSNNNNNNSTDTTDNNTTPKNELTYVQTQSLRLQNWLQTKHSILVITGAGMSTASGIPDYRGANGSYFTGHKPIIHHDFMRNESSRKRYWARSLVGYSPFSDARPNVGHLALARMEELGLIGVCLEKNKKNNKNDDAAGGGGGDRVVLEDELFERLSDSCYGPAMITATTTTTGSSSIDNNGQRRRLLSIITQNVDILHSKGGAKHVLHLHGRGDIVRCMNCGITRDRKEYHDLLYKFNKEWMEEATATTAGMDNDEKDYSDKKEKEEAALLRPDGDADWYQESYDRMILPPCPHCGTAHDNNTTQEEKNGEQLQSFYKTDVVFFGDSVPRHRFHIAYAAVDAADGVLCIGTSLAVHSAYRLAKRAIDKGTEVAILNVGETRIESEGLDRSTGLVTKIESPICETLAELVKRYDSRVIEE